jgi:hypothetical protein
MQDRIEKFQLIKGKDYEVVENLISPDSGSSEARPQVTKDYYLTTTAARWLAADIGPEKGREVIKFLVSREEQLAEAQTSPAPRSLWNLDVRLNATAMCEAVGFIIHQRA